VVENFDHLEKRKKLEVENFDFKTKLKRLKALHNPAQRQRLGEIKTKNNIGHQKF